MEFSVIVPVYNRPDEVDDLLSSLCKQTSRPFEVLIVEDGSDVPCEHVADRYRDKLSIRYFRKANSGPADTRNYGALRAENEWLLFFDSDCTLPPEYFRKVVEYLVGNENVELFGGPDRDHPGFTPVQKAISYAMTSFWTTGGIRGGDRKMDTFYPRTFNMGVSRQAFEEAGGFANLRFGEDVDLSMRIAENGHAPAYFPDAFVYHKRRTRYRAFFKQVFNSGSARIHLSARHRGTLKWVHLIPTLFTLYLTAALLITGTDLLTPSQPPGLSERIDEAFGGTGGSPFDWIFSGWLLTPVLLYLFILFTDALRTYRSAGTALRAVWASLVQLTGYGTGLLTAAVKTFFSGNPEHKAFERTFYE